MTALFIDAAILLLFLFHCAWMALFALEILFDTSLSTAAERWRTLRTFLACGLALTLSIAALLFLRLFQPGWYS